MSGNNKLKFVNVPLGDFYDAAYKAAEQNLPATVKLWILGKQQSKPQVLGDLAKRRKRYDDVEAARLHYLELVAERDAAEAEAQQYADGYAAGIKGQFGTSPTIDARYGVPRKATRRERTVEEKAQANAKVQATRELRGTKGPRAKEKIKATGPFTVTVTQGSDAASASAPAASPAPVPAPATAVASTPASPAPVTSPSSNGVSNGSAPPMLMNGADH